MAGVALGDIDLKATFLIGAFFFVEGSLWKARGFQSAAPGSKSDVCFVGGGLMICSILCSKAMPKWLCSKVMLLNAFQSDPATIPRYEPHKGWYGKSSYFRVTLWSSNVAMENPL